MAKIEVLYEHHPMQLECEKCGFWLHQILIIDRPKRIVLRCGKKSCGHQVEMPVECEE